MSLCESQLLLACMAFILNKELCELYLPVRPLHWVLGTALPAGAVRNLNRGKETKTELKIKGKEQPCTKG